MIRANDQLAEDRLIALSELLVAKPEYGKIWFSLPSLNELLAPQSPAVRIELLNRFRALYSRFGDRVCFLGGRNPLPTVCAEWSGDRKFMQMRVDAIDDVIQDSIAAGDLVGVLKSSHEAWMIDRERLWKLHSEKVTEFQALYAGDAEFRRAFKANIELLGTVNALDQCDDLALQLIVDFAKRPAEDLEKAKANPGDYPCTWTYALLSRLADYAASSTKAEWKANYAQYGRLLKADQNDYIDAYIAATGGGCGMLITNDEGLIDKLNFLHDVQPPLIRLQGFTVYDALIGYNPPNGDKRDRSKPIP